MIRADAEVLGVVIVIIVGILGLLVGSFLNVVIYRVPNGKSVVTPPSSCPHCDTRIKPRDNIPVVSWLVLRGKCRECGAPISARYPLVELGTAVLFVAAALRFDIFFDAPAGLLIATVLLLIAYLYFASISIALALIDIDTHRLPNIVVMPAYVVSAILLATASILANDFSLLLQALLGGVCLFALYFVLAIIYPGGMGFGDVKLAGVIGMMLGFIGWGTLIVGAFSAFLIGGVFGIALLLTKRASRKSGIPFGPWMLAGAWLAIFIGERVWNGYLGLFDLAY